MAYATVQLRILGQTVYKNNLEFQMMGIQNKQAAIAYEVVNLSFADPESPVIKQLNEFQNYLDLQRKSLETQQKAADQDLQSLQKLLDKNVKEGHDLKISA